jgi:AraC-like DNA-binding protein
MRHDYPAMSRLYFNNKAIYLNRMASHSGLTDEKYAEGSFGKLNSRQMDRPDIQIYFLRMEALMDGVFEIQSGQYDYTLLYNQQTACNIQAAGLMQINFPGEKINLLHIPGKKVSFLVQAGKTYQWIIFSIKEKILTRCGLPAFQAHSLYPAPVSPSVLVLGVLKQIHDCVYPLPGKYAFSEVKARELLFVLWDQAGLLTGSQRKKEDRGQLFESIRQFISTDTGVHYSIRKLSLRFGINATYLKKGFRKQFGKGVFQYLLELRMVQSRQLLADGTIAVSVIADKVGYSNAVSYIKAFKKYYGITPGQVRKK